VVGRRGRCSGVPHRLARFVDAWRDFSGDRLECAPVSTGSLGVLSRFGLAWLCFFRILFDGVFAFRVRELAAGRSLPRGDEGPPSSEPRAPRDARRPDRGEPIPTSDAPTRRADELDAADTVRDAPSAPDTEPSRAPTEIVVTAPRRAKKPEQSTTLRSTPAPRTDLARASASGEEGSIAQGHRREGALMMLELLQREGRFVDFVEQDVDGFSDADVGAAARVVHQGCRRALHAHLELTPIRAEDEGSRVKVEGGYDARALKLVGDVRGVAPYEGLLRHRGWRAEELRLPEPTEGHDASVLALAEVEL
jgi:hypothetical protein